MGKSEKKKLNINDEKHPAKENISSGGGTKRNYKDTVFLDLFSDRKYVLELYKALKPDASDFTEDDIEITTLQNVMVNGGYNDLGFEVNGHYIYLVEEQATWSENIVIRIIGYFAETLKRHIVKYQLNQYGTKNLSIPLPLFYVIYSGDKFVDKEYISLKEDFFGGADTSVDVKVKVITKGKKGDIIDQYFTFINVLKEQIKIHGRNREAVKAAIEICRDKDVLRDYLEKRQEEVFSIMDFLLDKDTIYKYDMLDHERQAAEKSEEQTKVNLVKSLMESMKLSVDQAMTALKIEGDERDVIAKQIKQG